jgi:hypothetical protein
MAWGRGYYYRVRRENGHVVREYVGRGRLAEAPADELTFFQKERDAEKAVATMSIVIEGIIAALVQDASITRVIR